MTSAAPSILVLLICLAILAPLAWLGVRQTKRAAVASDESVGSNFLAGMAFLFAFLASPFGILFSHLSLRQIGRTGASGVRLAIAGFYISYALTVVQLVALFVISLPR